MLVFLCFVSHVVGRNNNELQCAQNKTKDTVTERIMTKKMVQTVCVCAHLCVCACVCVSGEQSPFWHCV